MKLLKPHSSSTDSITDNGYASSSAPTFRMDADYADIPGWRAMDSMVALSLYSASSRDEQYVFTVKPSLQSQYGEFIIIDDFCHRFEIHKFAEFLARAKQRGAKDRRTFSFKRAGATTEAEHNIDMSKVKTASHDDSYLLARFRVSETALREIHNLGNIKEICDGYFQLTDDNRRFVAQAGFTVGP